METFGELLRRYRLRSGKTQVELAEAISSHQPFISNFERGRAVPDRAEVIKIGQALSLPESATNELLCAANLDPLDLKTCTGKEEISVADIIPPSQVFNVHSVRSDPSREFEVRIRDIQDLLTSLDQKIGSQAEPNELKKGLQQQIGDLEAAVEELKTKSSELTAPIKLPELQKIAVKLIPTTSFEALEGHRADENSRCFTFSPFLVEPGGKTVSRRSG
jgi:transcriptional regulator with XRE-family HTH domain